MAALIGQAAIGIAVSYAVGKFSSLYTRPKDSDSTVRPAEPRSASENLSATVEPGSALTGVFGHRRIGGKVVMSAKSGTKTYLVLMLAGAPVSAIHNVWINNRLAVVNSGTRNVEIFPWFQASTASMRINWYTGAQTAVDPWLDAAFGAWTANFVGQNIAYAVVEMNPDINTTLFADAYAPGIPDFTFDVSGFKCYDPRNGAHNIADPSTWTYSANSAVVKANYLIHRLGANLPTGDVDWAAVSENADICDQSVSLKNGGSEARYQCAAVWNTDERHEDVLARMAATDAGGVHLVGNKWRVYSGGFPVSSVPVSPDAYAGDGLSFSDTPSLGELVNGVRGKFSSPVHNFEDRDFPAMQDAAAVTADGREAWLDLDLAFVTSPAQAQRLARIAYRRARNGAPATLETQFDLFDTVADDIIALTDALAGFSATTFRVKSDEVQDDFTIKFSLEREDASFWTFTPSTDEKSFDAPDSATPIPGQMASMGGYLTASGTAVSLHVWNSVTSADKLLYTVNGDGTVEIAMPTGPVNLGAFGTVPGVTVQGKCSANGTVSPFATVSIAGAAVSTIDGKTEANTPEFVPAAPRAPFVGHFTGSASVQVQAPPGGRVDTIEFLTNTVNNEGTATLAGSASVVGGYAAFTLSGTPGAAVYVWTRAKNTALSKTSRNSPPVLVAF